MRLQVTSERRRLNREQRHEKSRKQIDRIMNQPVWRVSASSGLPKLHKPPKKTAKKSAKTVDRVLVRGPSPSLSSSLDTLSRLKVAFTWSWLIRVEGAGQIDLMLCLTIMSVTNRLYCASWMFTSWDVRLFDWAFARLLETMLLCVVENTTVVEEATGYWHSRWKSRSAGCSTYPSLLLGR